MSEQKTSLVGRPNIYDCRKCGDKTITVDRADGVTPLMIGCRVTPGCDGMGHSRFYQVAELWAASATHEWVKPEDINNIVFDDYDHPSWDVAGMREWVESGHLLLRRVKTKITEKQFRAALAELGKRARGAS